MPEITVRVKTWPSHGLHVRTPRYLRGKRGVIERELGRFPNPEQLAYGLPAPERKLVRVRFTMAEVWGAGAENPDDTLDAEIYEHWLEADEG
ncbi:SH3-like domain-containing protein [Oceanicella sp. SM1341]|uniref:SH3-like domain-containing protein n=1 Tax=Oceanicella sp. SM1341 TaxID=1548889 RepID=UPI000E5138F6|nr:SH3-like domain-containing protein [Oceanicella sp. SM1341]